MSTFRLVLIWYFVVLLGGALANWAAGSLVAQPAATVSPEGSTPPPTVIPLPFVSRLAEP